MTDRRITQGVVEADLVGTNRAVTQALVEADVVGTGDRRITQLVIEYEGVDGTPPVTAVARVFVRWR